MEQEKNKFEHIEYLLTEKRYIEVQRLLADLNEVDIAEFLEEAPAQNAILMFRMLPKTMAAEVFTLLPKDQQTRFISAATDKELVPILDEIFLDDMVDIVEEMPANVVKKILKNTDRESRVLINQLLKYPKDSAGSLMTTEYVGLKKGMTVEQSLAYIKKVGLKSETIYTCYVTDENRILEGFISLKDLVLADSTEKIDRLFNKEFICVNTHDDQEKVAHTFKKYGFLALPVVDNETRLIGIITVDDIMDVMEQEATEDFQRMAAMQPNDETYLQTSIFKLAKHRIGWLLLLMVSESFTGTIIEQYTHLLASMTILTAFIPMLMDTGGNSGSQSSTLIIRGLATGEIDLKDWRKVFWKEFRIALMVGAALGSVSFVKSVFLGRKNPLIALSVGVTLVVTVMIAKITGGLLPIAAKKLKLDPAIMAGPLITTVVDTVSLIVYFKIATFFCSSLF
ncbi:magnesium transporter [Treponema pedis]|uniref:magnesium transporter n=2 Tax=Treponema pedis TaxID=409322 RepID=UPI0004154552|nr:magnesium transporter [Treponema pedis]QSI04041.1 magnesium transporter [Treponema pedis]